MEAQRDISTGTSRYTPIFRAALRALPDNGAMPKILSFGCSTGEEVDTLRKLHPKAEVHGCDVKSDLIDRLKQREDGNNFFMSTREEIAARGPFDMIACMSVLCSHPGRVEDGVWRGVSVDLFDELLGVVCENLALGGVLVLYNSNFILSGNPLKSRMAPVRAPRIYNNGFIDLYSREGHRIARGQSGTPKSAKGYSTPVRYLVGDGIRLSAHDLSDTIWKKSNDPNPIILGEPEAGGFKVLQSAVSTMEVGPVLYCSEAETPAYPVIRSRISLFGVEGALVERTPYFVKGDERLALLPYVDRLEGNYPIWVGLIARGD